MKFTLPIKRSVFVYTNLSSLARYRGSSPPPPPPPSPPPPPPPPGFSVMRYGSFAVQDMNLYLLLLNWRPKTDPQTRFIRIYPEATSLADLGASSILIEVGHQFNTTLGALADNVALGLPAGFSCYLSQDFEFVLARDGLGFAVDLEYIGPDGGAGNINNRGLWWALYEDTDDGSALNSLGVGTTYDAGQGLAYFAPVSQLPPTLAVSF